MSYQFRYRLMAEWPPLAWLATWKLGQCDLEIRHGRRVESCSSWFGEVIWDGDFEQAGFDQTDIVYGSAGKAVGDGLIFVASATTLDRLHSIKIGDQWFVSNSLMCLLAETDGRIDRNYRNFPSDFRSIIDGVDDYRPFVTRFQAVQHIHGKIDLLIEANPDARIITTEVAEKAKKVFGGNEISIRTVEKITGNLAGKHCWVVSHLYQKLATESGEGQPN